MHRDDSNRRVSFYVLNQDSDELHNVVGGGRRPDVYEPDISLPYFNNEGFFNLAYRGLGAYTTQVLEDKIVFDASEEQAEIYESTENINEMEFSIILKRVSTVSQWEFELEGDRDLEFHKQDVPPDYTITVIDGIEYATWSEIVGGNQIDSQMRLNLVGGYRVRHRTKRENNYKTGFMFYINRPTFIDANGDKIFGEIDITGSKLIVKSIDKRWLDNAAYPVTVDPTFGYAVAGQILEAAGGAFNAATIETYIASLGDTFIRVYAYLMVANGGSETFSFGLYDVNITTDRPNNLLEGNGAVSSNDIPAWLSGDISVTAVDGESYKAVFHTTGGDGRYYTDIISGRNNPYESGAALPPVWTSTLTRQDREYSVYGEYDIGSGSNGNFTFTQNLVDEPDSDTRYTMYFSYITKTIDSTVSVLAVGGSVGDISWSGTVLDHIVTGDFIDASGFTDSSLNGEWLVTSTQANLLTATKQDGATIASEAAGNTITVLENPFDGQGSIIVKTLSGSDITGQINAPSIFWDFDYDNNVQGGRFTGTDQEVVVVYQGLNGAQWNFTNYTILRQLQQLIQCRSIDELNFDNPV